MLALHRIARTIQQVIGRTSQRYLQHRQSVNEVVKNVLRRHIIESLTWWCRRIELSQSPHYECCHLLARHGIIRTVVAVTASQGDSSGRELAYLAVEQIVQ